ncbi:hypothetical protein OIU74_029966 [Salix koriyanagi]|uniref:Uncharacterized protein n=1 Tax=Salix koriyanagi TaxID=2511006 RepID=A0A9Q0ZUX2_9ROSI|nr:hypothetical protein OIU74_029966 [Salix koriyanagi]
MGQSLKKLAPGSDENKEREIGQIIEDSYEKYFGEEAINKSSREVTTSASYFTRAVCEIVEQINTSLNSTQLRLPEVETLKKIYKDHSLDKGQELGEGGVPEDSPRNNNPFRVYRFWLERHDPLHLWDSFNHILHQATSSPKIDPK